MTRVSTAQLERIAAIVCREHNLPDSGRWNDPGTLLIDADSGGKRLMQVASTGGGQYAISPRLSAGDLETFLRGMMAVVDVVRHYQDMRDRP